MSRPGPTNYTANVNRAKTKKWVEAKSYSYDGDDWGDVDDYDEYGGYDEPEPEPAPKPTGLRQRGQSASHMPAEGYDDGQTTYQTPVDNRQQLGSHASSPQQQEQLYHQGPRNHTHPQTQQQHALARTNSFDRDDERRVFSAGGPQRHAHAAPARDYAAPQSREQNVSVHDFQPGQQPQDFPSQTQPASARYGEQIQSNGGHPGRSPYPDQARQPNMDSRAQSMTSNNSSMDFHNRRDFSPSAIPPPLHTRGAPSPYSPDGNSSSRPPRKSSLGQSGLPTQGFPAQFPSASAPKDSEEEMFSTRDRAGSGAEKQLPFVRPAEIYRRMQEEKLKERQSQESSRPSMEAITGRPNDRPSMGKRQDSESSQRLKLALDPVTEQKSEHRLEGLSSQDLMPPGDRRSTSKTFDFPKRESKAGTSVAKSWLGPVLPDVSRVSGFGESFFGTTTENYVDNPMLNFAGSSSPQPTPLQNRDAPAKELQHQPSLGFTSAVHQAFDKAEDQVPPTPSSTQGSSVARSTSGGTSTVSPIISRGPSTATENWNSRLPPIDDVATPMIPEGPEGRNSRPASLGSSGTPTQIARKLSPSQDIPSQELEQPPLSFIPGYRRTSDPPSRDNSPRRTPALETTRPLRQPQEIELAAATPTDQSSNTGSSSQTSEVGPDESSSRGQPAMSPVGDTQRPSSDTRTLFGGLRGKPELSNSPISPSQDRLRDRKDSSGSNRVRSLADKFESGSRPGSSHSTTPRASMLGGNTQRKDDFVSPRPLADRMESFRPHLPGGWESSASIAPASTLTAPEPLGAKREAESLDLSGRPDSAISSHGEGPVEGKNTSAPDQQPSAVSQMKDASEEAFAAVAAAGSALAGAFGSAVGMQHHDSSPEPTPQISREEHQSRMQIRNKGSTKLNQGVVRPEASRPNMPIMSDDEASSAAPTPLLISDTTKADEVGTQSNSSDYFPSSSDRQFGRSAGPLDETRPLKQPPTLPLISTDTKPTQYESDRLRKEIVRELTPMSASEPTTAETDDSNYQPTLSTNPSGNRHERESGVLPREYESYWNDATSEVEVEGIGGAPHQVEDTTTTEPSQDATVIISPLQPSQGQGRLPPTSLKQREPSQERAPMLPHRFSWEQPLQAPRTDSQPALEQSDGPISDFLKTTVYPDGHFEPRDEPPRVGHDSPLPLGQPSESPMVSGLEHPRPTHSDLPGMETGNMEINKELPNFPSGLEVASSTLDKQQGGSPLTERANFSNATHQQHLVHDVEQPQEHASSHFEPPQASLSTLPQSISPPPPADTQLKVPAFREVLALKTPAERILAYNGIRQQFAEMNTGLAHWLALTFQDLPEHADLVASSGRPGPNFQSHKPSPSRSKLGGLLPSGGQSSQQPYFQQYLNASPQPSGPDGNAPGSGIGGGPSQGFSPSGTSVGKLSSQQVQAKGKDLLHTAGVFGGKANVAAKGLFSKGKSKLRAASGNEKAISHQPNDSEPLLSRGMQKRTPSARPQPSEINADPQATVHNPVYQASPIQPLSSSQALQHRPPQDTPSAESSTQSQFGDDERSEESEPTSQDYPPRNSSLIPKNPVANLESDAPTQYPLTASNNAPNSPRDTPSAESYVASPKDMHTPRSTTSSNRTPTQANFTDGSSIAPPEARQLVAERATHQPGIQEEIDVRDGKRRLSSQLSSPQSFTSSDAPWSSQKPGLPTKRDTWKSGSPQKQSSGDSKSTIRNVDTANDRIVTSTSTMPTQPPDLPHVDLDRMSRAPARMSALAASEILSTDTSGQMSGAKRSRSRSVSRPASRPVTPKRDSLGVPRASGNYLMRSPSIDSLPTRIDLDRPPSPLSPEQPTTEQTFHQRGRTGPIHYGIDHDFVPNSDHDRFRSRSRSVSRIRSSHDSSRSKEPSILDHPAFRNSNETSPQPYPGRKSRDEALLSRQQAPEYEIEAVGPALEWPSERTPRSRRGSRSSAFFRSLTRGSSSKTDDTPLPNAFDNQLNSSPVDSSATGEKKSKRASILRSLTGHSGSDNGSGGPQRKGDTMPTPSSTQPISQSQQPGSINSSPPSQPRPQADDDEFPSRGNSRNAASKLSKRVQRSSTSVKAEPDGSKKKRFSAIGTLFGRGRSRRQSSSAESPRVAPTQSIPQPTQQQEACETAPISESPRQGYDLPKPRDPYTPPPPGGYYAPNPPQTGDPSSPANQGSRHHGHSSPWNPDTSAYIQDASLRQRIDSRMSPPAQIQTSAPDQSSGTVPQASPQYPSSTKPEYFTTKSGSHEPFPERSGHQNKKSGSSWTRFSQHGRSKSRQQQPPPPSNPVQQISSNQSHPFPSPSRSNLPQSFHPTYPTTMRSESPPPPPPPPKDDWHRQWPLQPTSGTSTSRNSRHNQSPSMISTRPLSSQDRQSLQPLQTDMANNQKSSYGFGKARTPEEKRRSRQQEIENSTLTPQTPTNVGARSAPIRMMEREDEPVVMTATSFPGQEWRPDYAHWDGD